MSSLQDLRRPLMDDAEMLRQTNSWPRLRRGISACDLMARKFAFIVFRIGYGTKARNPIVAKAISEVNWDLCRMILSAVLIVCCSTAGLHSLSTRDSVTRGLIDSCTHDLPSDGERMQLSNWLFSSQMLLLISFGAILIPIIVIKGKYAATVAYLMPLATLLPIGVVGTFVIQPMLTSRSSVACDGLLPIVRHVCTFTLVECPWVLGIAHAILKCGPALRTLMDSTSRIKTVILVSPRSPKERRPDDNLDDVCSICLCPLMEDEDVIGLDDDEAAISILTCGHQFHNECITSWLTGGVRSCPLCRV